MRRLPGYFRPSKEWDIVVRQGMHLVAAIEESAKIQPRIQMSPYQVDEDFQTRSFIKRYELEHFQLMRVMDTSLSLRIARAHAATGQLKTR
jgi:hypothetical protein